MKGNRDVFAAIADPSRRKILDLLSANTELALFELTEQFEISRTAVSKHLTILKEAGLVDSHKVGRETRYSLNARPLKEITEWVAYYEIFWQSRLVNLDELLQKRIPQMEEMNMADVSLDYQYQSSIEEVWQALTKSDILAQWIWENNFKAEENYEFEFKSEPVEYWDGIVRGKVLKVIPLSTLQYSWNSAGEETVITWNLSKISDTETALHFEMDGFSEETKQYPGAIQGATHSWGQFAKKLGDVLSH